MVSTGIEKRADITNRVVRGIELALCATDWADRRPLTVGELLLVLRVALFALIEKRPSASGSQEELTE